MHFVINFLKLLPPNFVTRWRLIFVRKATWENLTLLNGQTLADRTKPGPSLEDAIKIAGTYHAVPTNTAWELRAENWAPGAYRLSPVRYRVTH